MTDDSVPMKLPYRLMSRLERIKSDLEVLTYGEVIAAMLDEYERSDEGQASLRDAARQASA